MTVTVVHCSEDALSAHCARYLMDRVVAERVKEPSPCAYIDFAGNAEPGWSTRGSVRDRVAKLSPRLRLHVRVSGHAALAYKCVRLATIDGSQALLLSFDSDRSDSSQSLRAGVQAARANATTLPVVVAEATPEFDAWIVMGHEPTATHTKETLASVTRRLGFDPRLQPDKLTSDVRDSRRDAKKLCKELLHLDGAAGGTPEVTRCLDADLETLKKRGAKAGFPEFVADIERELLPIANRLQTSS